MNKLILAFLLIMQPLMAYAGQPLSRELITSFYTTVDELDKFEAKHPKEFHKMDGFSMTQKSEIINYIKSSSAYPDIRSTLNKNGFSDFDGFIDVSIRLMGGLYYVSMQSMSPQERQQMQMMEKSMEDNIKIMKSNGMADSVIAGMNEQLQDMEKMRVEMKQMMKYVTSADKKFVNENFDWLQSIMPDEK